MTNDHLDLHYAPEQSFPMDGLDTFKAAQKAAWVHFAPMQAITIAAAPRLVEHARIRPGTRVLDVACGTGVAPSPPHTAARRSPASTSRPNCWRWHAIRADG